MNKGVTGYQLVIIITIIIGVIILALLWVFMKSGTKELSDIFDNLTRSFQAALCGLLGSLGKMIFGGVC